MRTTRRLSLPLWLVLGLVVALPGFAITPAAAQTATTTFDYTKIAGLSQPLYPKVVTKGMYVDVPGDNSAEKLYVEVTRPDPAVYPTLGERPVILEASPYHGTLADRKGTRIFPDPRDADENMIGLTGYFAPRGYAVVMVDLRGTGRSTGCLDHLGPNDAADLKAIVEWAADQDWSNGRVGMTGHSYVGSTPKVAAAQDPEGLVTIAPSAGLASMYDHQFQYGVPYLLQWAGPMFAYEQLSAERHLPGGDNFGGPPPEECQVLHTSLVSAQDQVTGQYDANPPMEWHAKRDYRAGAIAADIPVFMIHGVNDNAARIPAAEWFFGNRYNRPGDKTWIGQWDHGSAANTTCAQGHPNCRFVQWQYALHAWFDKHLIPGSTVDTGPAMEAFLNGDKVYVDDGWKEPALTPLYPDASDGSLKFTAPTTDASVSFPTIPVEGGSTEFVSAPLTKSTLFRGVPQQQLIASLTGVNQVFHLVTTLYSEAPDKDKTRTPMNYCAIQPSLRGSQRHKPTALTPIPSGAPMDLDPLCFTMAHHVPAGHKLVLEVSTASPHHVTGLANVFADEVTVYTGPTKSKYELPLTENPPLVADIDIPVPGIPDFDAPNAPAQPPVCGDVVIPATAGELRLDGVNVGYFEFDSLPQYGNKRLDVLAKPSTPADVDLFLQYKKPNGKWSEELGVSGGGSFDFEKETMSFANPWPARYRVGVVNWAGQPALTVEVCVTFFDAAGNAGKPDEDKGGDDAPPGSDEDTDPVVSPPHDGGAGVGDLDDNRTLPATGGGAAGLGLALLLGGGLLWRRRSQ